MPWGTGVPWLTGNYNWKAQYFLKKWLCFSHCATLHTGWHWVMKHSCWCNWHHPDHESRSNHIKIFFELRGWTVSFTANPSCAAVASSYSLTEPWGSLLTSLPIRCWILHWNLCLQTSWITFPNRASRSIFSCLVYGRTLWERDSLPTKHVLLDPCPIAVVYF